MRRGVILFGLVAMAGLVAWLLISMGDQSGSRRSADQRGARSEHGRAGANHQAGDSSEDGRSKRSKNSNGAIDNDPNRIPGPEILVRGIVLRNGKPVEGATVQLRRTRPAKTNTMSAWTDPRRRTATFPPITEGKSDEGGRFSLRAPRRSKLDVVALKAGAGPARATLFVPNSGDPGEVKLRLTEAHSIRGIVINEKKEPVAGAKVTCSIGAWTSYPFITEVTTDEAGKFDVGDMARGTYNFRVETEGYPAYKRSVQVPEASEIQLVIRPGGSVRGKVVDSLGSPIAGGRVILNMVEPGEAQQGSAEATTAEDGTYVIPHAPPGNIQYAMFGHTDWGMRNSRQGQLKLPSKGVVAGEELVWNIEIANGVTARGIVVEKVSGRAVPGANLEFFLSSNAGNVRQLIRHAAAGSDGRFEVSHLPEGSYVVGVKAEAYARYVGQWVQQGKKQNVDFYADGVEDPKELRLEVEPSGRIEGQVVGEAPENLSQASVNLGNNQGATRVDSTGFFFFDHVLATENQTVKCWNPQCESEPFAVTAGEVVSVELKANSAPHFIGTVTGDDGMPVAGAYVKACPEDRIQSDLRNMLRGGSWGTARTDAEGKFRVQIQSWQAQNFASQNWAIAAVSFKYPLQIQKGLRLPKEGNSRSVEFVFAKGGTIAGTVELKGSGPLPTVSVTVSPKFLNPQTAKSDPRQARTAYTDFAGRFEFVGIGDGEWTVTVGYANGKAKPIEAMAGAQDVRMVIEPTLAISGTVVDDEGEPVASATVKAMVLVDGKETFQSAQTDSSGRFRLIHLVAGEYPLEVSPQRNQNQMYFSAAPSTGGGFKKTNTVPYPAGAEGIVITVEPGARIRGVVHGPDGKPVPGAGVMAIPPKNAAKTRRGQAQPTTRTNGKGEFTLKGVEEGAYEVVVIAAGYLVTSQETTVGQNALRFRLDDGGTIKGLLLRPDGKPAGSQWLQLQPLDAEVMKKLADFQSRGNMGWNNIGGWNKTSTSTKSDGTFEISGLFEGKYKVTLQSEHGVVPATELHTGSPQVTIRMTPALTITGTMVLENGDPVSAENGPIYVNAQTSSGWASGGQPDADGNFTLKGLPEGEVKIRIFWKVGKGYQQLTHVAQAGDTGVRITLKAPAPKTPQKK